MPLKQANGILLNNIINTIIGITYMGVYYKKDVYGITYSILFTFTKHILVK